MDVGWSWVGWGVMTLNLHTMYLRVVADLPGTQKHTQECHSIGRSGRFQRPFRLWVSSEWLIKRVVGRAQTKMTLCLERWCGKRTLPKAGWNEVIFSLSFSCLLSCLPTTYLIGSFRSMVQACTQPL